jgi:hypothetical protein
MHLSEVLWGSEGEPEGSTNLTADGVANGVLEIADVLAPTLCLLWIFYIFNPF